MKLEVRVFIQVLEKVLRLSNMQVIFILMSKCSLVFLDRPHHLKICAVVVFALK